MSTFMIPGVPEELNWKNNPLEWRVDNDKSLFILAGENTNWFIDPNGDCNDDSAPCALFIPKDKKFIFSAKVNVGFASAFDAGVIQIRVNDELWGKLCFEYSPQHQPMIVSVVNRGVSDDCNSVIIDGNEIFLRVALTPKTISFHYSHDGSFWHFVRYFTLGNHDKIKVGLSAQSPTGKKCEAIFSEINYSAGVLKDNRSGE